MGIRLSAVMCLSLIMWWSTSAAETDLLPEPSTVEMADTTAFPDGTIGIVSCANKEVISGKANIVCFFVLTQIKYAQRDYLVKKMNSWKPRLIDNLGIEHEFVTLYMLNRRGQQQETVNLAKGDSVWFAAEFAGGGAKDINAARVVFTQLYRHPQLRAPVRPVE